MLRDPTTTRALALSQSVDEIASAVPTLEKQGFRPALESEGVWTGGRTTRLSNSTRTKDPGHVPPATTFALSGPQLRIRSIAER